MSLRPTEAIGALQTALAAAFRADGALRALVQGRIHDGSPAAFVPPYLAFAEGRARDWSGGEETGARVTLTLEAVTADGERGRAVAILDRALGLALALPPALGGGTLVLIRPVESRLDRLSGGRGWRARGTVEALVDG